MFRQTRPDPGLLHRVLGVVHRAEHPVGQRPQARPVLLEPGDQRVVVVHHVTTAPILLTGGTGTLGRLVVPRLLAAGRDVRVLSRARHDPRDGVEFVVGDLSTGEGVADALTGVDTVVHCAGDADHDEQTTRTLTRAAAAAGVRHLIGVSVVGADRVPVVGRADRAMFSYFANKRAAEIVVAVSGVPWSMLRATQFHDLVLLVARSLTKLPVVPVPAGIRFQPVEADEVAARLVELSLGPPQGLVPDLAGPRVCGTADLLRGYLRTTGKRRLIVPVPLPGGAARALRAGANLAPDRAVGQLGWEDFLAKRLA